eukprot:13998104-Ditylum_brightwellii.AAC.1
MVGTSTPTLVPSVRICGSLNPQHEVNVTKVAAPSLSQSQVNPCKDWVGGVVYGVVLHEGYVFCGCEFAIVVCVGGGDGVVAEGGVDYGAEGCDAGCVDVVEE